MKQIFLLLGLVLCGLSAYAQGERTIVGNVIDNYGEPLIGATVVVPRTSIGTTTDIDGNFRLSVPATAEAVEVAYTGYTTTTVPILGQDRLTITMADDVIGLSETVVIGYAPVRRKDLVGSVASVSAEDANREAGATIGSALRRAAGVVVQQTNGTPGAGFNIRVRGSTSINASNEPLYVVDGIPIVNADFTRADIGGQGASTLSDINPNDIESIEVLKDASTTAIYGSRAANGVVLITTKKGKAGKTEVNFNASYGWNSPIKTIDVVDGPTYVDYVEERYGFRDVSLFGGDLDTMANSNWQDLIFDTNPIQTYGLSLAGGDTKTRFFASLNYDDNQGIVQNTQFQRYNARLNLDHTISDKFLTSIQMSFNRSDNQRVQNDNNIYGAVSAAILLPPAIPVLTESGAYGSAFGLENPVAAVTDYSNQLLTNRFLGNASATYLPTEWLKLTAKIGVDAIDLRESIFEPSTLQSSAAGIINEGSTRNTRLINEYVAAFTQDFGNTSFVGSVAAIYQNDNITRTFFVKNNVPDNTPSADAAAEPADVLGDLSGDILQSYVASANFSINDNLFISGSFRADGSSRFINNRWGYFPGIAAGYDMADLIPGFSQFKVRASYGQTGNNNVGNFASRPLYSGTRGYLNTPGISPLQIANPDLRWESTTTVDLGLDVTLLEQRIFASLGIYQKNTEDLLFNRPLPTTSGFNGVLTNIGEIRNRGFELSATFVGYQTPDFTWSTNIIAAYNDNEVIELFDDQPLDVGFASRVEVGQPLGAFYGYVTDGIFQNQAEVDAAPLPPGLAIAPGDFRFKDLNDDGVINDEDRMIIGQALPKWTGGISNDFFYKGFDLNFFFQFSLGNEIYNNNLAFAEGLNSVFAPTVRAFEGAWREEGDGDDFPRIGGGVASTNNRRDSDRFIEDGSFVRLKTAQLGYTFNDDQLSSLGGVGSVRLYVQGTNLATFSDYSWYDPEVNTFGASATSLGTDFLTYPVARTVQLGINVGF